MLQVSKLKVFLALLLMGNTILFSASLGAKKFDVETGMVLFEISGKGQLTADINISIKGEGKLRFRDWGVEALLEEDYVEVTTGVLSNVNRVHLCKKFEEKQRFDVDFATEKILERPMPKGNFKEYYLKGLEKTGQETIAGYTCDVWESEGVKKCLYKGIPLLVERYLLGVYYQKKAVDVQLNIKPTPEKYALPNYPVEKFSLFKTNLKTKSLKPPKELSHIILNVSKELQKQLKMNHQSMDDLNEKQKQAILDKIGQSLFEKSKAFLPKFLETMKEARVCLQQVDSTSEANKCIADVVMMKKRISENVDNRIESWDDAQRAKVLDDFDENIATLDSKMKCIRASKNLSDLSRCMK